MISVMKSLCCAVIIASLTMPSYVFANTLHLPSPNGNQEADSELQTGEEGEPLQLPQAEAQAEVQSPEPAPQAAQAENTQPSAPAQKEVLTGLALDKAVQGLEGKALIIPQGAEDTSFLKGGWMFDRFFISPKGHALKTEFYFDENGLGSASFVSETGLRHTAPARAAMSDGALKIQTGAFSNAESSYMYYPEFMQCANSGGAALCQGTDGFSSWEGARLISSAVSAPAEGVSIVESAALPIVSSGAASGAQSEAYHSSSSANVSSQNSAHSSSTAEDGAYSSQSSQSAANSASSADVYSSQSSAYHSSSAEHDAYSSQSVNENVLPGIPGITSSAAGNIAEVSGEGAELAPGIMESAEKAKMEDGVSSLAGDWRYSRDLTRKDGESVALEFHFNENGKGYSLIKEGSGKEFKASAEAMSTAKGTLRVKTSAYSDGKGNGYHPTFMECKSGKNKELLCDVSNGWTRIEGGSLVSQSSLEAQNRQMRIEDLLPVSPPMGEGAAQAGGVYAGEAQAKASQSGAASAGGINIADMLADLSETSAQSTTAQSSSAQKSSARASSSSQKSSSKSASSQKSSSQSASSQKSSSQSSSSSQGQSAGSSEGATLSLPKSDKSMAFLEGKWRCNTGLVRMHDGQPVVVEFQFDKNGRGTANVLEKHSGIRYDASARANYKGGVLRLYTSDYTSKKTKSVYVHSSIECRDEGGQAICSGQNGKTSWKGATFVRIK